MASAARTVATSTSPATPDLVLLEGWRVVVLGTAESIARLQRDGDPGEE
jgi:hypothetical protein